MISPPDAIRSRLCQGRVLAAGLRAVKVRAGGGAEAPMGGPGGTGFALFGLDVLPRDLLDEIDDAAAQVGILMRMKALVSDRPLEVARKSGTRSARTRHDAHEPNCKLVYRQCRPQLSRAPSGLFILVTPAPDLRPRSDDARSSIIRYSPVPQVFRTC